MRKIFTLLSILISSALYAQQNEEPDLKVTENKLADTVDIGQNELKLNLFPIISLSVDISYERILKNNTAVGLTASYCYFPKDYNGWSQKHVWAFIPHYRIFFGRKRSAGFFLEANGKIAETRNVTTRSYTNSSNIFVRETIYHDDIGYGFGFTMGVKLLTPKGFVGEIYGGAGRYLNDVKDIDDYYPRIGIILGKRF